MSACHWLVAGRWFSPGAPVSYTNKTDRHIITELLLKVALNTITLTPTCIMYPISVFSYDYIVISELSIPVFRWTSWFILLREVLFWMLTLFGANVFIRVHFTYWFQQTGDLFTLVSHEDIYHPCLEHFARFSGKSFIYLYYVFE